MTRSNATAWIGFLGGIVVFLAMAVLVTFEMGGGIDRMLFLALHDVATPMDPWGPAWFEEAVGEVTALGGYTLLISTVVMAAITLFLACHNRLAWLAILSLAGGSLLSSGLKLFFDRARPDLVDPIDRVFTASFPSGHAMLSTVVWLTLALIGASLLERMAVKVWLLVAAAVLIFAIGLSRVYLGVHWPSDVIAGWALGAAWASLCWLVISRHKGHST